MLEARDFSVAEVAFEAPTVDAVGTIVGRTAGLARQVSIPLSTEETMALVEIPSGEGVMGSAGSLGYPDERPAHRVAIPRFYIGRHLVTQGQWDALVDDNHSRFKGARLPVDNVSYDSALVFCRRLSEVTGLAFRLPSEAEWEYACRAGTTTPFCFGETITTELANYNGTFAYGRGPVGVYRHRTTEVGRHPPNAFGLHDMHGNLWEWCADPWHDDYTGAPSDGGIWEPECSSDYGVLRGGSWHDHPEVCRSAVRLRQLRGEGDDFFGFRVAVTDL